MAAAYATLEELERDEGRIYGHLFDLGQSLMEGIRALARKKGTDVLVQGPGPMFHLAVTDQPVIVDYRSYLESDQARYRKLADLLLAAGSAYSTGVSGTCVQPMSRGISSSPWNGSNRSGIESSSIGGERACKYVR